MPCGWYRVPGTRDGSSGAAIPDPHPPTPPPSAQLLALLSSDGATVVVPARCADASSWSFVAGAGRKEGVGRMLLLIRNNRRVPFEKKRKLAQ